MTSTTTTTTTLATVAEYVAADAKGKAAIRKAATEALHKAVDALDMVAATAAKAALESYKAPTTKAPAEVDWQGLVADRIATLQAAVYQLSVGGFDGAPDGFEFDGRTGTVDGSALAGLTKVRKSARRDLGAMIEEVVDGDFVTVAGIRARIVAATEGDYVPSDGAIAARLFPSSGTCTLRGIVPVEATGDQPRGAQAVHVEA